MRLQMLLAAMLVYPVHAALEDAEETFNGIRRVRSPSPRLFAVGVIDRLVLREAAPACL